MSSEDCVEVEFLMWDGTFIPGTLGRGFVDSVVWHPVSCTKVVDAATAKYFGSEKHSTDKVKDVRLCVGDWRISLGGGSDGS